MIIIIYFIFQHVHACMRGNKEKVSLKHPAPRILYIQVIYIYENGIMQSNPIPSNPMQMTNRPEPIR